MMMLVVENCNFKNMQGSCVQVPHTKLVVRAPGLHQLYHHSLCTQSTTLEASGMKL